MEIGSLLREKHYEILNRRVILYFSPGRVLDDDMDSLAAVSVYQESDTENQARILKVDLLKVRKLRLISFEVIFGMISSIS